MITVCDLETTSTNPFDAEIIEGHFIAVNDKLEIVSEFELKCNPFKWSVEAEKIHKISRQQAMSYKKFSEVYEKLISWITAYDIKEMWMHTRPDMFGKLSYYDYSVLRLQLSYVSDSAYWLLNSIKPYSTLTLAKVSGKQFQGYSLDLICRELGINLSHHNAQSDAYAALEIMRKLPLNREAIYNHERGVNNEESDQPNRKRSTKRKSAT